jgi:hypothetical protein
VTVSHDPYDAEQSDAEQPDGLKETTQTQAKQVADTAKGEATQVAETAKEQVQAVSADVRAQTRELADKAREQLAHQAASQRDWAVGGLRTIGDELVGMAKGGDDSGPGVRLARAGGELTHKTADFLEQREPAQLLEEVRDLARRRPGAFLAGAALTGLAVGRATRGVKSAHTSDGSGSSTDATLDDGPVDASYEVPAADLPTSEAGSDVWGPGAAGYPDSSTTSPGGVAL